MEKRSNGYSQKYCCFWTVQDSNQTHTTNGKAQKCQMQEVSLHKILPRTF